MVTRAFVVALLGVLLLPGCRTTPSPSPAAPTAPPPARTLVVTTTHAALYGRDAAAEPGTPVTLRNSDGLRRATALTQPSARGWEARLRTRDGAELYPRPGDRVEIGRERDRGTESKVSYRIPPLTLSFRRRAGQLSGRTAPAARVSITVGTGAQTMTRAGRADASGRFTLTLPAERLTGGAPLEIVVSTPNVRLAVPRRGPFARVSLHPGDITGAGRPRAPITATLTAADGSVRAAARAVSDLEGRYSLWLRDEDGLRVRPAPGDRVTVNDGDERRTIEVTPLSATADLAAGRISGRAEAGHPIDLVLWNPWLPEASAAPTTTTDATGTWSVAPEVALAPASHFYVTERLPGGDLRYYCQQVPRLHISPGAAAVTVETLWDVTAELALVREATTVATAAGGGPWSGDLELTLRDSSGQPVAVRPGDELRAVLDGRAVAVSVPPRDVELVDGQLRGRTTAGRAVRLAREETPLDAEAVAGPDGRFVLEPGDALRNGGLPPGEVLQVYAVVTRGPEQHSVRQTLYGPELVVDLNTGAVRARLPQGASGRLLRSRPDGTERTVITSDRPVAASDGGEATAGADRQSAGWQLTPPAPLTPPLTTGDTLVLEVDGRRIVTATLPALDVALRSPVAETRVLTGRGPPDGRLRVEVRYTPQSPAETLIAAPDADGRWTIDLIDRRNGTSALPPGIRSVELVALGPGYEIRRTVTPLGR